ncbi:MAG: CHRD domain-containing protein [Acidobacteriota bacterium]
MKLQNLILIAAMCVVPAAQGASFTYTGSLSGANEVPPVASPGTGFAVVSVDTVTHLLTVDVTFSGLLAPTTASHIHCCTTPSAGVATQTPTFSGFPLGVTAGSYSHVFDMSLTSTFNASFVTANGGTAAGAEAALVAGLNLGNAYLNVHSSSFPAGEIRANLVATPEPAAWSLMGLALAGLLVARKRFA